MNLTRKRERVGGSMAYVIEQSTFAPFFSKRLCEALFEPLVGEEASSPARIAETYVTRLFLVSDVLQATNTCADQELEP